MSKYHHFILPTDLLQNFRSFVLDQGGLHSLLPFREPSLLHFMWFRRHGSPLGPHLWSPKVGMRHRPANHSFSPALVISPGMGAHRAGPTWFFPGSFRSDPRREGSAFPEGTSGSSLWPFHRPHGRKSIQQKRMRPTGQSNQG